MRKLHLLDFVIKSLQSFQSDQRNNLHKIEITMAPDVFYEITDEHYYEFIGFRRFVDKDIPEGHIRIIGTTRHGKSLMLSRVKF
jgi:hypothetical protein